MTNKKIQPEKDWRKMLIILIPINPSAQSKIESKETFNNNNDKIEEKNKLIKDEPKPRKVTNNLKHLTQYFLRLELRKINHSMLALHVYF
jgi:hypothetical protein